MSKRALKTDSEGPNVSADIKSRPGEQQALDLPSAATSTGPVECLGMTFPNDDERRKYFLDKLAEKLKDPEFRKIEGFPIGEDEDILAISDPPYYTACPNPWIADFIKFYGTRYNPKKNYHREPFATDVSEGKYDPQYKLHPFPTKVPHKAIMRYLLYYTEPGDLVFDGFCGTGMTGVAAQLCADMSAVQSLGYRVTQDKRILTDTGDTLSHLGPRRVVLNELSSAAGFISWNQNMVIDQKSFEKRLRQVVSAVEDECSWMFTTAISESQHEINRLASLLDACSSPVECSELLRDTESARSAIGQKKSRLRLGRVSYMVWSDAFGCPECGAEIVFWDSGVDKKKGQVRERFSCSKCNASLSKRMLERLWVTGYDEEIGRPTKQGKQVPVLINYRVGSEKGEKIPDRFDHAVLAKVDKFRIPYWFPTVEIPKGDKTGEPIRFGIKHVHHFYTKRNLWALAAFGHHVGHSYFRFLLTKVAFQITKMYRFTHQSGVWGAGGGPLSGTLYIPSLVKELDIIKQISNGILDRARAQFRADNNLFIISTQSSCHLQNIPNQSFDYIFVDPPFGANLMYSELNFLWEAWLRIFTNQQEEAIENITQQKGLDEYRDLMTKCFVEAFRILKPGRWMTVEFSNTKASVWNTIQAALQEAGFVVANVSVLDKKKGSFKAVTTPTAVKQDLVISAYKPNGGLEDRFAKLAETEEGVWAFVSAHLRNLPVVKPRGGVLEPIAERDPRILYDRAVAFYVRHIIPVPISSPEFQAGLAEKFPERDGMYFLPDQAAEYDKVRMKMEGIGQLSIFVMDERSAVDWLRNYLKAKPSKYQDIQPEFFEQLNQAWKKWETRPELRALLDQYFLCYHGEGDVPAQIHSYLSTNFKDLRNMPSDHPMLRSKARNRWYVPDPKKNADVERMREKRFLDEFWSYLPPGYEPASRRKAMGAAYLPGMEPPKSKLPKGKRLAIVRTEAVRVGFNFCFSQNDYETIIAVAQYIPDDVIHNDEQLQMIYDSAVTRVGGQQE